MSGYQNFAPLQAPTSLSGTLFREPDVREGKKGFFVTGKLKVQGGGFIGFIAFDELAVRVLSECHAGQAIRLDGYVKPGKPYASKQTGELVPTLDLTVEYAATIEHEGWQNVRSEKGTAPPRQAQRPAPPSDNGTAGGETLGETGKNPGEEGFDDDIPF